MRTSRALALLFLAIPSCTSGMTVPSDGSTPSSDSTIATDGSLPRVDGSLRPDTGPVPCEPVMLPADTLATQRAACTFAAGARAADTLGIDDALRRRLPIRHIVVVMQENRSFDHQFATLHDTHPEVEAIPPGYASVDRNGVRVAPFPATSTCMPDDPPHQWAAMHTGYADGAMDGFVRSAATGSSDGHYAMAYHTEPQLPFYHWAARTFAISDRYFGATLGGTWANRDYLYAGSSYGVKNTGDRTLPDVRTVFDQLDEAGVTWGVFTDGNPRQDALGWDFSHEGHELFSVFLTKLRNGTLPAVSFVDPAGAVDEHPPNDVQPGEAWTRRIYTNAVSGPLWPGMAIFFTYDESGGLFDHVAPPSACLAAPDQAEFDRLGIRVPLIVMSPYARPGHVSHQTHSHTSILRFIQLLHGLPALTGRDASSDALLDLFDFRTCPAPLLTPPAAPNPGTGGCP